MGPEALAGGPIGKLREGDRIQIVIDRNSLEGSINFVGETGEPFQPEKATQTLADRPPREDLSANPALPDDTRLWATLQGLSGGTWGGCVYDVDAILAALDR